MSAGNGFGPPPGAPDEQAGPSASRPRSYLPPGQSAAATGAGYGGQYGASLRPRLPGVDQPLLMTSHKPGIVALRPLSAMDLLDGSVKHIRGNPGAVLGLSVMVLCTAIVVPLLGGALASAGTWWAAAGLDAVVTPSEVTPLIVAATAGFASLALSGLLAASVGDAVIGRRPTARQIWQTARGRLLTVVGVGLLVSLVVGLPAVGLGLVLGALASADASIVTVLAVSVLGALAVWAWAAAVLVRTCTAAPAAVLEHLGLRASLRRAWRLSSGRFWLVCGRLLLVGFVTLVVFWVVQLPLLLLSAVVSALLDLTPTVDAFVSALLLGLATVVSASVVVPFVAGAVGLLYCDLRMRSEGFDIVLRRAVSAQSGALR